MPRRGELGLHRFVAAAARSSPQETHLLGSSRLLGMDEASPEEILTISRPINTPLPEVTTGNKYGGSFPSARPFITLWGSFPRCWALPLMPHRPRPLLSPVLPQRIRLFRAVTWGIFPFILFIYSF